MNREYKNDKEYSILEIIRYNLKMWWLAAILAIVFAGVLGGYKYVTLSQYVDNDVYEDRQEVRAVLYVLEYSNGNVIERANNIMKIAQSSKAHENFCAITGSDISLAQFRRMFKSEQTEASDVVTFYVGFPYSYEDVALNDEEDAIAFMNAVIEAVDMTAKELMGMDCVTVLDEPYASREVEKMVSFTISQEDYQKAIMKALTAGVLLGIIIEITLFTMWMILYKKPKNIREIQECLNTPVIDVFKSASEDVERYKKVALYLKDQEGRKCINCISVGHTIGDTALKIAMCYANEQKKTLYIDLNDAGEETYSISKYIIGKCDVAEPESLNKYLDTFHRNIKDEKGYDLVGNGRFAALLNEMSDRYDCIVVGSGDAVKSAEGFNVAALCNKNFIVCTRKNVRTEALCSVRNTAENNGTRIDGVLVYDV